MIENKEETIKELRQILNKDELNSKEERELFFFKLRDLENKAIYYKDDQTRETLRIYEKSMFDKTSSLMSAYEEAKEEGRKNEKFEIAKTSLAQGIDINTISIITGLSIPEIEDLKKNN